MTYQFKPNIPEYEKPDWLVEALNLGIIIPDVSGKHVLTLIDGSEVFIKEGDMLDYNPFTKEITPCKQSA